MFGRIFELRVVDYLVIGLGFDVAALRFTPRFLPHCHVSSSLSREYVCFTFTVTTVLIIATTCRAPSGYQVR